MHLPIITIEVNGSSTLRSLGWLSGPSFVYTGFLSIYLLARENNLLFKVEQKDLSIIFILEPIEDESYETNSNYLNLI